jgi:hypothetical protein
VTNTEAKQALFDRTPITYNGIKYDHISAIIYRHDGNNLVISAELADKNKHSVTIAQLKDVILTHD